MYVTHNFIDICTLHIILLTYVSAFPGRGRHFTRWTRLWSSHRCHTGIRSRSFVYLPCSACCWFQISRWNKDYLVCEVGGALFWQKRWQYLRKGKEMITELTLLISGVHLEHAIFSIYILLNDNYELYGFLHFTISLNGDILTKMHTSLIGRIRISVTFEWTASL